MQPITRASIRCAQARFEHGLHDGDGTEHLRTCESQLEGTIPAPRNAGNNDGLTGMELRADLRDQILGEE